MNYKSDFGFLKVATVVPNLSIGNPRFNAVKTSEFVYQAKSKGVDVLLFPELSVTGYTCGDMFSQVILKKETLSALEVIKSSTINFEGIVVVGAPIEIEDRLFNTAVVFSKGIILGIIPKTNLPSYGEFYDTRWFTPYSKEWGIKEVEINNEKVPFGTDILFKEPKTGAVVAIEICEDLFVPISPSSEHAINGANVILNLSGSDDLVGKANYRKNLVSIQSSKTVSAYVYVSSGPSESTTDMVFGGHSLIIENGSILKESRFVEDELLITDIDIEILKQRRVMMNSFKSNLSSNYLIVPFSLNTSYTKGNKILDRSVSAYPFIPGIEQRDDTYMDILTIQTHGIMTRLKKTGIKKVVIGVSGGLDSTWALIVLYEAFKKLNYPSEDIIGITMPGFGTSDRTKNNALELMSHLGITSLNIPIVEVCTAHLKSINHPVDLFDVTFENVQARERTAILMNVANKENALVVGTGNMSELALGWCTYNGDHMSMYAVNSGLAKSTIKDIVPYYASMQRNEKYRDLLMDVFGTPISPELLPLNKNGEIAQKTEDSIGKYAINDFILYNSLRNGFTPAKIKFLALNTFKELTEESAMKYINDYFQRFFSQQFKRSAMPDGVKVGSVNLSPRGNLRMPSDMGSNIWLLK